MGTCPPKHVQLCSTRNWESLDLVIGVDDSYVGFFATVGDCGRQKAVHGYSMLFPAKVMKVSSCHQPRFLVFSIRLALACKVVFPCSAEVLRC